MGNPSPVSVRADRINGSSDNNKEVKMATTTRESTILSWPNEEDMGPLYLYNKRRDWTVASELVETYFYVDLNLTGRTIKFGFEGSEGFEKIEPTDDIVTAERPLEEMVADKQWPTIEKNYVPDRPYYEWASVALEPNGSFNPELSIRHHDLSHLSLVNPDDAAKGIAYGRMDLVPVFGDSLWVVNLTDLPLHVEIPDVEYEAYLNPDASMPHPVIVAKNDINSPYYYKMYYVPPLREGVVYAVRVEVAIMAHALGRYDFVAVEDL